MDWYYKLHELPQVKLGGMFISLLRWADLLCFYPIFVQAASSSEAEEKMEKHIKDLVVYNAPLKGPFPTKEEAVRVAKIEYNKLIHITEEAVIV